MKLCKTSASVVVIVCTILLAFTLAEQDSLTLVQAH